MSNIRNETSWTGMYEKGDSFINPKNEWARLIGTNAAWVFALLLSYSKFNKVAIPKDIQQELGISKKTFYRIINFLINTELIKVESKKGATPSYIIIKLPSESDKLLYKKIKRQMSKEAKVVSK